MAFTHGKGTVFKIDNAAGTITALTSFVDSVDLKHSVGVAKTTTMGSEVETYVSGQSDGTLSISGKWDGTATTGPHAILTGLIGLETTSSFEYGPSGSTSGMVKKTGECFLTGYVVSAPVGDVVTFTADFQITGAITEGVWP